MFLHVVLKCCLIFAIILTGLAQKKCTERVCRLDDAELKFFLIGDWGGLPVWPHVTLAQKAVAKAMEEVGNERGNHFHMALGDNFYIIGVKNVHDKRFKTTFEDVFNYGSSNAMPWYVLAGNHDHYGDVSAQIAYSDISQRWVFPNYYYTVKYQLISGTRVDILVIDTVQLCGNTVEGHYRSLTSYMIWGPAGHQPQGPDDPKKADQQWKWLERNLARSRADYLFVAGHYPVWSIAEHGPTTCLVERLRPLLHKYRVNAYFSGHDHNLQHLNEIGSNGWRVDYVISGAAAYEDHSTKNRNRVPPGSSRFFYPKSKWDDFIGQIGFGTGGFVFAEITPHEATFRYATSDLDEIYSFRSLPRTR